MARQSDKGVNYAKLNLTQSLKFLDSLVDTKILLLKIMGDSDRFQALKLKSGFVRLCYNFLIKFFVFFKCRKVLQIQCCQIGDFVPIWVFINLRGIFWGSRCQWGNVWVKIWGMFSLCHIFKLKLTFQSSSNIGSRFVESEIEI